MIADTSADYWPGPAWEPTVYINKFPLTFSDGDLYVYTKGLFTPGEMLWYLLAHGTSRMITVEEAWEIMTPESTWDFGQALMRPVVQAGLL